MYLFPSDLKPSYKSAFVTCLYLPEQLKSCSNIKFVTVSVQQIPPLDAGARNQI